MFAIPLRAYMSQVESSVLLKTPLHVRHVALGARMVPFGGWEMPVEYSGISDEHMTVRTGVGVFDVSHMGEVEIAGKDALAAVQRITSNDAANGIRQIQDSGLMTADGTFVDYLRLPDGRPALPAGRERLEHSGVLPVHPRAHRRRRRRRSRREL